VCSETERITDMVMNRHDYDRLAQRLGPAHSAEPEGRCGKVHPTETPKTAQKQPDELVTSR
jgi:hypothetical protein